MEGGLWLTIEKGDELLPSALSSQGEGDGRKSVDGIQAEEDIIVLRSS